VLSRRVKVQGGRAEQFEYLCLVGMDPTGREVRRTHGGDWPVMYGLCMQSLVGCPCGSFSPFVQVQGLSANCQI
jgi:hypothetical protein